MGQVHDADGHQKKNLTMPAGVVVGEIRAELSEDGQLPSGIVRVREDINRFNQAASEISSVSLMGWRSENNDMNKRMGELRSSASVPATSMTLRGIPAHP